MSSNLSLPADTFNLFPANPQNHVVRFSRMPNLSFVVQEVNLPGITATIPNIQTGGIQSKFLPDRLTFEPLTVSFLVDEEFRVHRELYQWLWGMTGGTDRSQVTAEFINNNINFIWPPARSRPEALSIAGATHVGLTIVNPAKIPILRVLFYNAIITSLGGVQFQTSGDPLQVMTATATFEYEFYTIMEIRR